MKEKTGKIFIYLAFLAVILGCFGVIIISQDFTGQAVKNQEAYSMEEIAKHNDEKDCWISFEDKVYDITLFLQIYPDSFSDKCGGNLGDIEEDIRILLENYKIGSLE